MIKYLLLSIVLLAPTVSAVFATTVSPPSIRYTISNHTGQRIYSVVQLESADQSFTKPDTVESTNRFDGDFLQIYKKQDQFKPYLKLVIQTNAQRYSTPVFLYKDRCTAYAIDITAEGLSVKESNFYRIRGQVIEWYIVFMITFSIRGGALLIFASRYVRTLWFPFIILNTGLVVLFQLISTQSIVGVEWRFLLYALIPLLEFISYYSLSHDSRNAARLLSGIVVGGMLWVFPGYLLILFSRFLFAGC